MKTPKRRRPRCTIGVQCRKHCDQVHGLEAEELRKGVEKIIGEYTDVENDDITQALQRLLDTTDARDSLAFLEATQP
jgi:hypothetical protein